MTISSRNNVHIVGDGPLTVLFAHGFGCDQNMWRSLAPNFEARYRTVMFDLVGSGSSDLSTYDRAKYGSLHGYASDVLEIIDEVGAGPVIYVGHSVSAMIGMLAAIHTPERFLAIIMVGPSPSFIDDGDYVGGFTRGDIEAALDSSQAAFRI